MPKKITDTGDVNPGARADEFSHAQKFYKTLRSSSVSLSMLKDSDQPEKVIKRYHLESIEFGRWVTFPDRADYLIAVNIAFDDLNRVLRFGNDLGFDKLHFAVGARGKNSALAHFEPQNDTINITRFHRPSGSPKVEMIEKTGGISSIAHEYGHFLDYFFGSYIDQSRDDRSLSGGQSVAFMPQAVKGGALRKQMEVIMQTIIWAELPGEGSEGKLTSYYKTLKKHCTNTKEYWIRRNEIFARAFEVYVYEKQRKRKILNKALTHDSQYYKAWPYFPHSSFKPVMAEIDKLISLMRKIVVDGVDINELN